MMHSLLTVVINMWVNPSTGVFMKFAFFLYFAAFFEFESSNNDFCSMEWSLLILSHSYHSPSQDQTVVFVSMDLNQLFSVLTDNIHFLSLLNCTAYSVVFTVVDPDTYSMGRIVLWFVDKRSQSSVIIEIQDVLTRYPSRYRWIHPQRWHRVCICVLFIISHHLLYIKNSSFAISMCFYVY